MAEKGNEYDQYAPQTEGRLFNNSMFGFNKDEVLEYLEDVTEENYKRQATADQHIQNLNARIQDLEGRLAKGGGGGVPAASSAELDAMRGRISNLSSDLDVARTASQQAEGELQEFKEQLHNSQRENAWLREEHQKGDKQLAELRRQLDEASSGKWQGAEEQISELRRQLSELEAERDAAEAERDAAEAERDAAEAERDAYMDEVGTVENPANLAANVIIAEATEEAERIRKQAYADRDRLHRQILTSAGGLANSIGVLKGDLSSVENDVSGVLESIQEALGDIMSSLNRTEQSLDTLGIQAERFPATSPAVSSRQPVVYFRPEPVSPMPETFTPEYQPSEAQPLPAAKPAGQQGFGTGSFRPVTPDTSTEGKTMPFRPSFTTGSQAATARVLPQEDPEEERRRQLSETLVDTLIKLMN